MAKVIIKKDKSKGYNVSFSGLTPGEILSMRNALNIHSQTSPVGEDVRCYLANGVAECSDDILRNILSD